MTRLLMVAAVALVAGVVSGAGAEWDVYLGAGTPIQAAIDAACAGDILHTATT